MQRFALILALLLALAAIGGTSASYASAYSSVTLQASIPAACSEATPLVAVSFKACGKMKSTGVVASCSQPPGLLVTADELQQPVVQQTYVAASAVRSTAHPGEIWLRPPKAA